MSTIVHPRCGLWIAAIALAGCADSDNRGPRVAIYPVRGRVLLADGRPLSRGQVWFIPTAEPGEQAIGAIQPDGTFELTTRTPNDGAVPGIYRVRIKPGPPPLPALEEIPKEGVKGDGFEIKRLGPGEMPLGPPPPGSSPMRFAPAPRKDALEASPGPVMKGPVLFHVTFHGPSPKYENEDTSGLVVTVKAGRNDLEPFRLASE